jgi:hypothetical protein
VLEEDGDDTNFKFTRLEDSPAAAMRHPGNDISKLRQAEDGVHLGRKVGDATWKI